ncbi:MAG TPA: insulinase family protein, partial [Polyangiales bacterium]|nr:insulinase family protein [Polyangiales bacterium]
LARAHERLADARRRALAADPARPVDELAAQALLGDAAHGLFPFGSAAEDAALGAESIERVLRDHYGPTRALLVAAGDVQPEQLEAAAARAFAQVPAALAPRARRDLQLPDAPRLETAIDERPALAFAVLGPDEALLRGQAQALTERLAGELGELALRGHVFGLRGAALGLVRIEGAGLPLLAAATRELSLLRLEAPQPTAAGDEPDDLASISRGIGLRFAVREPSVAVSGVQFGAGCALEGAPGGGPRGKSQLAQSEAERKAQVQQLFQRALASAEPRTRGEIGEYASAVVTENGARIDVQFAHSPYVAIAVRIAGGAELDPADLHGRSALLATLTASACAGLSADRLRNELLQLGAALEPRVNAESYGLLVRAPPEHWQAALDLTLRCARQPSRSQADFAMAALRLQERFAAAAPELALRARAAGQITPRAPGMCAPWGDPGRAGNLTQKTIQSTFRDCEVGARWSVAVVGSVPIAEATSRAARRLADLPSGSVPRAPQPGDPEPMRFSVPAEAPDSATFLATWSAKGQFGDRLGAAIFASAMHARLALIPGVEVLWQDADTYAMGAYAALQLRANAEAIPKLPAALTESGAKLPQAAFEEALERALPLARQAQSSAEGEASVRADRLARTRL